jgi:hypothetical protein
MKGGSIVGRGSSLQHGNGGFGALELVAAAFQLFDLTGHLLGCSGVDLDLELLALVDGGSLVEAWGSGSRLM